MVGLITSNKVQAYLSQVEALTHWCQSNNLTRNVGKKKEMVVDFRRQQISGFNTLKINKESPAFATLESWEQL